MVSKANEVLERLGISESEILRRISAGASGQFTIYLSGSHLSGYATKWSDLDVFVLGDAELIFSGDAVKQSNKSVMNVYVADQRVDYEHFALEVVRKLKERLTSIDWSENISTSISSGELDFMYRLLIGAPVANESFFNEVVTTFPKELLRRYLYREALEGIENSMEDLGGLTETDDRESSILVSCLLVEFTMDSLGHHLGNLNPSKKWRMRIAKDFVANSAFSKEYETYLTLRFPERHALFNSQTEWKRYAEACASFSENVVTRIQSQSGWL